MKHSRIIRSQKLKDFRDIHPCKQQGFDKEFFRPDFPGGKKWLEGGISDIVVYLQKWIKGDIVDCDQVIRNSEPKGAKMTELTKCKTCGKEVK